MERWKNETDRQVLEEIGRRLEGTRLDANVTQQHLASASGVSKSTIERLEKGQSVALKSFIRVVRALGVLAPMMASMPLPGPRPTELAAGAKEGRKRASNRSAPAGPWTWGDE